MALAVIDTEKRALTFANAGMTEPLLCQNKKSHHLKVGGMRLPLGIKRKVPYEEMTIRLQAGDLIAFYTDGLPEAMNPQLEQFELRRLETSLCRLSQTTRAAHVVKMLLQEVERFCGDVKPHDDMTLVVVRVL
jgi:sigma-B regulation protein RsbU (phosphoserine phosphatase)